MTELTEYLVKATKRLRDGKVSPLFVLAAVSTSIAVTLMIAIGAGTKQEQAANGATVAGAAPSGSPAPSVSATTEASEVREVGGLDVKRDCDRLGFDGQQVSANEIYCQSSVELLSACQSEHPTTTQVDLKANDPYSASCLNATGKNLGGISDMLGYCRDASNARWANQVTASTQPNNKWHCRIAMDIAAACAGQYNMHPMTAKWISGSWRCFSTAETRPKNKTVDG